MTNNENKDNNLGVAGKLAKYFIDSRLTVLIIIFAFLAGITAFLITPREENPQIIVPAANIIVAKPGATPDEVEQLIIKPLESILQGMRGVEHTYGIATDSMGVVTVQFNVGEDKEDSLVKLYDHIMSNIDRIPPGTEQPLVKPVDVDNVPILSISLSSDTIDDAELRRVGNRVMEVLRRVDGTSVSYLHGGRPRTINVELELEKMKSFGVSLSQITDVLDATNVRSSSGTLVSNNTIKQVRAGGMLQNADDLGKLVVALYKHKPVYLSNIATITDGPAEITEQHRFAAGPAFSGIRPLNYEIPAVSIAIAKRSGSNAVTVAEDVLAKLDEIRSQLIPADINVNVTRNDGARADAAVNILLEHLAIAIATVVLLLIISIGWRAAAIVTMTIPLILFITLAIGYVAGQSINRITLFALILSLGLLVDDSIVVIENIYRHYSHGTEDRIRSAIHAVSEIGRPTNLATFAVILAFLPMFWVTGMMGPYMAPIPFYVPVAMIVSLAIAYTVAPWAANKWLKTSADGKSSHEVDHSNGIPERLYGAIFKTLADKPLNRRLFLLAVVALLLAVFLLPVYDQVKFKMLPKNNTNTFNITIDMPESSSLENTDSVARRVGDIVRDTPHVINYETTIGKTGVADFNGLLRGTGLNKGAHVAEVRVNLTDKLSRSVSSIDIVQQLRPAILDLATITGANIKLVEDPPGPPVRATLLAELYGPDYEELRRIAKEIRKEVFDNTADVVDVDDSVTDDVTEYEIHINREKSALAGIPAARIIRALNTFIGGFEAGTVHIAGEREPVAIRFQISASNRVQQTDLENIFFLTAQGKKIQLSEIAEVRERIADKPIFHKDQVPVVYVTGELASTSQVYAIMKMKNYLDTHPLPGGIDLVQNFVSGPKTGEYTLRWDGEMRLTLDVFRDLGAAFAVALILIYLVLVGYFQSFMLPIIVMGAIPLTMIGVFPGHAIMGQYFTATSMIGFIALAGVVVRNSLLLIDFIIEYRRSGHGLEQAVFQAGITRLRPILLTAIAIVLGTMVMIFDPVFGGLAVSLIFGTVASTILTLFVIPLVYLGYCRRISPDKPLRG
ncbi:MAG: efflux RND transporter permease subunit [Gammaproteobacteria bacterium]|nr:efflux RND transporter permease subunit [Gammaproteobacteria bacterium]MDX2488009.1 efflux RND transporter permease subunit [Gammaproteobacteria bacterium]